MCVVRWGLFSLPSGYTTSRYVDEVYLPQAKDLNTKYAPDLIWSDGDWEANSSYWKSPGAHAKPSPSVALFDLLPAAGVPPRRWVSHCLPHRGVKRPPSSSRRGAELLAWLYNDAPNKDDVVVNDR